MYSGNVEVREEERDGEAEEWPDFGRGGSGEVEVAKSSVATLSVFTTGLPHEGQKRTLFESSVPQKAQFDIEISRYRITQESDLGARLH